MENKKKNLLVRIGSLVGAAAAGGGLTAAITLNVNTGNQHNGDIHNYGTDDKDKQPTTDAGNTIYVCELGDNV